ncbi:hypothetical protein VTK73DRAFT_5834 [Phialemonium thermophilum]|uniref:Uncharacterized protein n=1 Tax=Phialemonium thermophilum TaxID=223376 RepID=A0ABR3WLP7_9PEZI
MVRRRPLPHQHSSTSPRKPSVSPRRAVSHDVSCETPSSWSFLGTTAGPTAPTPFVVHAAPRPPSPPAVAPAPGVGFPYRTPLDRPASAEGGATNQEVFARMERRATANRPGTKAIMDRPASHQTATTSPPTMVLGGGDWGEVRTNFSRKKPKYIERREQPVIPRRLMPRSDIGLTIDTHRKVAEFKRQPPSPPRREPGVITAKPMSAVGVLGNYDVGAETPASDAGISEQESPEGRGTAREVDSGAYYGSHEDPRTSPAHHVPADCMPTQPCSTETGVAGCMPPQPPGFDLLASPPRMTQDSWPSLMGPIHPSLVLKPPRPVSGRGLRLTRNYNAMSRKPGLERERIALVAPRDHKADDDAARTQEKEETTEDGQGPPAAVAASPKHRCTSSHEHPDATQGTPEPPPPGATQIEQTPDLGAESHGATSSEVALDETSHAKTFHVQRGGCAASASQGQTTDAEAGRAQREGMGGTGDQPAGKIGGAQDPQQQQQQARRSFDSLSRERHAEIGPTLSLQSAGSVVIGMVFAAGSNFVSAYWAIVGPVFDPASPIALRFSQRRSTWRDAGVYVLAVVFLVSTASIGVYLTKVVCGLWNNILITPLSRFPGLLDD